MHFPGCACSRCSNRAPTHVCGRLSLDVAPAAVCGQGRMHAWVRWLQHQRHACRPAAGTVCSIHTPPAASKFVLHQPSRPPHRGSAAARRTRAGRWPGTTPPPWRPPRRTTSSCGRAINAWKMVRHAGRSRAEQPQVPKGKVLCRQIRTAGKSEQQGKNKHSPPAAVGLVVDEAVSGGAPPAQRAGQAVWRRQRLVRKLVLVPAAFL